MKDNSKEAVSIIERQNTFINERPTLAAYNTDPLAVVVLLQAEIDEFIAAYTGEESMAEIAREVADIIIFALTLFKTLELDEEELDIEAEVHAKIARNEAKYPKALFQEGSYPERAAIAKKRWIQLGGDKAFYAKHFQNQKKQEKN